MRRVFICVTSGLVACLLLLTPAFAGKANPADYPLRVHILENLQVPAQQPATPPPSQAGAGGATSRTR